MEPTRLCCSSCSLLVVALSLSGGGVNPSYGLITSSSSSRPPSVMEKSSYHAAASFAAIDTHDRIVQKNTRSIVNWKLYAANHGASREYLASLSAAEAAENTANITEAAGDDHQISTNDFISSSMCDPDDIDCILAEKINGDGEDVVDEKIFLQDTMGAMAKVDEVIEDDDYASSMLFPVRSDIVNGGDNNNNNNNNSTLGGEGVSSVFINGDEEECIISSDDASNQQSPNTSSKDSATDLYTIICSSDTDKVSKFDNLDAADDDDDEKSNRATTHSLLKEGENLPDDSATYSTVGGMAVARYLRRKLSRTNENDDENEMTQEQRRQQWTQWMTTGRKSGSSSTTTTSTDISFDESLLNIDKGEDYVVVAVPADAVANNNVGVKLSSFPGGKLFQKTVANMQRELLENRNVTKVSGGSDDSKQEQQQQQQQQQQERAAKNKERKKKEKKERTDKKYKEKVEAAELEKQMKLRQQQINLEQRIREKGRVTANDWKHNMGNLFASTILRDVRDPVLCVFVWATTWSAIYKVLSKVAMGSISCKSDAFVAAAGWFTRHASLPSLPHSMMVSAMSLLLVFRTNSAYQRFVEGRKIWNDIVDTSRDFSRYVKLYEFAIGTSKVRRINALLASFPYLLRHRIRPSLIAMRRVNDPEYERDPENSLLLYPDASLRDTDPDLAALAYDGEEAGQPSRRMKRELCWVDKRTLPWKLLPGSALELCARAQNRPLWVCDRMAKELAMVDDVLPKWTNRERLALIGCVDKLSRSIGACERIHQTVVPLNYARHALRSLTVWLWTLPLVMAKDLGLMTGPVVAVVSWILFGVYEIGSRIEDPFQGTLRLSIYCDAIRRDVLTDSLARDTAFELEEESKVSMDDEGDEDAIFELDSESEEYGGDDVPLQKQMKTTTKKKSDSFLERFGL